MFRHFARTIVLLPVIFLMSACNNGFRVSNATVEDTGSVGAIGDGTNNGSSLILQPRPSSCRASNSGEYLNCINLVQSNQVDLIEINGMITCSGAEACHGYLGNINRTITIMGMDSQSGFIRDNRTYTVLQIDRALSVVVKNLIFDDGVSTAYNDSTPSLPSTLSIDNTVTLTIDGVRVEHSSAQTSVSIANVSNLVFSNSTVSDGGAMGLWLNGVTSLKISNCTFSENRSNAIFIESQGMSDSVIENSQFYHNHRMAIYNSCGGPCGGGQIAIVKAWNLTIRNNHIWNGNASNVLVGGIELNNPTHMTIRENVIESHTGAAIYSNTGTPIETNILNNTFLNNGSALYNMTGAYIAGNGPQK